MTDPRGQVRSRTWDVLGPANQDEQLSVEEVTQGQEAPELRAAGGGVWDGAQRGRL